MRDELRRRARTRTSSSGCPLPGQWTELINTDAETYGGSGVGNLGTVTAHPNPHQGQPASATLRVPPLGTLWLASPSASLRRCTWTRRLLVVPPAVAAGVLAVWLT